jgi:DNA-binding transcriptional MerR regulator
MWTITEVCAQTGLSPRTIRYYEEMGLLPDVRRRSSGRRVYGADELERLGFISRLKALGLSLSEIRELNAVYAIGGSTRAMLRRLQDLLDSHLEDVDRRIAGLEDLRRELSRYRGHVEERIIEVVETVEAVDRPEREPSETQTSRGESKARESKERMAG